MQSFRKLFQLGVVSASLAGGVGCATVYRGAIEVDPADVPRGRLVATFARTSCSVGPQNAHPVFVDFVQGTDGSPFIVERIQPDEWLLITNGRVRNDSVVFQTVRKSDPSEFREYRFPGRGTKPGEYFSARRYSPPRGTRHRFETRPLGQVTTCQLIPVDPLTGAPLATYGEQPRGETPRGWGFDGTSFEVGDRVLVDVGGRSVPARVLQAPGDAYYVQFEGGKGDGRWIDPSSITGRVE